MKKLVFGVAVLSMALFGLVPMASALTFTLDCVIGNGTCTPTQNFGTVTITNIAGGVNVAVDTSATAVGSRIQIVALNTTGTVTSSNATFTFASNAVNIGPYCNPTGCFDVKTPATGNLGFSPQNFTLLGAGVNEASFNTTAGPAGLFAGVHIGACEANTTCAQNGGSLFVGASGKSLPLPATMLLMGASFLGLGIIRRFQK